MVYDPATIEPKWQERWLRLKVFESAPDPGRPKYYCYNPAPYVTGSLHMGHVRNYTCGDFLARFKKLRGAAVLYTIGFDAYGLPTEMAAIRNSADPEQWTSDCLQEMKRQLVAMGCGFDWRRSFITSDPGYYRWTQWIFLQLYHHELVYRAAGSTQWCPQCETSLARAQAVDGVCWICGSPVERRTALEWRLRLSPCLDDLLRGLEEMRDLNGLADRGQRVLIGARAGLEVELRTGGAQPIRAFMAAREDWLSTCVLAVDPRDEATRAALSLGPDPDAAPTGERLGPGARPAVVQDEIEERVRRLDPGARFSGVAVTEMRTGREISVFLLPGMDPAFADRPLVLPVGKRTADSGAIPDFPPLTIYAQKDFSISRQRVWGTPIPIVYCESCGEVPVPLADLPVPTPKIELDPAAHRLKRSDPEWDRRTCPRCGKTARLDPQVMDCHMDSIWHPFRPCASAGSDFLFDPAEVRYWMPADIIQFGRDVIPFMLDLRYLSHFLHRLGHVPFREFCRDVLAHGLILHEGRKMSKHLGNVVRPDEVIRRFGADSMRFYVLAHAEPKSDFRWSQEGLERYRALLSAYHDLVRDHAGSEAAGGGTEPAAGSDGHASDRFGRYTNVFLRKAARELRWLESSVDDGRYDRYAGALARLLSAMDFFRSNHLAKEGNPRFRPTWRSIIRASALYLAPVAPHMAEECWELLGHTGSMFIGAPISGELGERLAEALAAPGREDP